MIAVSLPVWLFAIVVIAIGVYGIARPIGLLQLVARFRSRQGLWAAAGLRLLFAVVLWLAAPASRFPLLFQALAVLALAAAVALLVSGTERFKVLVDWTLARPAGFTRSWSALAVALGLLLIWAVTGTGRI